MNFIVIQRYVVTRRITNVDYAVLGPTDTPGAINIQHCGGVGRADADVAIAKNVERPCIGFMPLLPTL